MARLLLAASLWSLLRGELFDVYVLNNGQSIDVIRKGEVISRWAGHLDGLAMCCRRQVPVLAKGDLEFVAVAAYNYRLEVRMQGLERVFYNVGHNATRVALRQECSNERWKEHTVEFSVDSTEHTTPIHHLKRSITYRHTCDSTYPSHFDVSGPLLIALASISVLLGSGLPGPIGSLCSRRDSLEREEQSFGGSAVVAMVGGSSAVLLLVFYFRLAMGAVLGGLFFFAGWSGLYLFAEDAFGWLAGGRCRKSVCLGISVVDEGATVANLASILVSLGVITIYQLTKNHHLNNLVAITLVVVFLSHLKVAIRD